MKRASEPRAEMVLKAYLSRAQPERKEALERFLSESERLELEKLPPFPHEVKFELFSHKNMLEKVHWSWFLPTLRTYPETEQKLFLAALDSYAAKNLAKALTLSLNSQEISAVGRNFLRKLLLDSLLGPEDRLLPIGYLPLSPLTPLLERSKQELIRMIDFLSLYDLSAELRQIVETKMLKKIYSFLSEEEKRFLKTAAAHKDSFHSGRLGLERWDGTEQSLRTLLHKRGLARFGAALSGQNPDLIWYICHQLDIGRGTALDKLCAQEPIHGVSDAIIRQIEELI